MPRNKKQQPAAGTDGTPKPKTPITIPETGLLNIEELSAYLRITVRTLRGWVAEKRIPFRKVGCHVRFSKADVDEWSKGGTANAND